MSKTVFKVGMKVYDEVHRPGEELEVCEITNDNCITVKTKDNFNYYYSPDGSWFENGIPTLSTTPYTVELKGFSQENLKKGQIVWVRDDEEEKWQISHFLNFEEGEFKYKVSSSQNAVLGTKWRFLTTQNPYENIE